MLENSDIVIFFPSERYGFPKMLSEQVCTLLSPNAKTFQAAII